MSRNLQLQVVLNAIDKATRPIKAVMDSSSGLGKQLKQTRDQLKGLQAQQKDIESFKKLKDASRTSTKAMSEQQQRVRELAQRMRETENPTKTMTKEFESATHQAKRLKDSHDANAQQMQVLRTKLNEAGISTGKAKDGTEKFGIAERELRKRIDETSKSLDNQKKRLQQVTDQQKRLSAAKSQYDRSMQTAGKLAMGGAAGAGVAYGVKRIADQFLAPGIAFGAQMSELQAVSRLGKDDERFKMLKQQARGLGASTAFSASEVGAGQTFLARAGFSPEAIGSSLQDILNLALANGVDLARTADIASNISGAFKIDPEVQGNMQRVGDVLSGVSARANVDLEMLGDTMKYLGKAEGLDMSLEQAAAMAGVLGNIGIQSSQAGTTMRAMLDRLSAPAGAGAKAMKALNLEVADASGNMRDIPDIIADIATATAKMGNVEQAKYLKDIFGSEAGSGMAELIAQHGTGGLTKLINDLKSVQGESAQMAATRADNIAGDLKNLSSAWEEIGNSITDTNEGPLRDLIQSFTDILRGIGKWAGDNPELVASIAKAAVVVGLLAGAGGTLMITIASILGPLAMLKYGLTLVGIAGGTALAPVVLAVASLALAAFLLYKNWDTIKTFFIGLWIEVKEAFSGGIGGIGALIVNWLPLGLFYKAFAAVMSYFDIELPSKFTEFGGMLISGLISGIKAKFSALKDTVTGLGDSVGGWFKDKLGIRSPSRVFMQFGSDTAEGLAVGIAANKNSPLKQVAALSKQVAAAGAMSMAAGMSFAGDIQFDNRAPISAQSSGSGTAQSSGPITIHVHAAAGMNEQALAQLVQRELEKAQRQQQVRTRSRFGDLD